MMDFPVHKYGLIFRLVEEIDAAFILSLRTDPKLAKHLSPTRISLADQEKWIRSYKQREAKSEEYYFLFESEAGEPLGVVRLYDLKDKTYNSGSWLIKPGCNNFEAIRSDLFISEFALDELKFERCLFEVRKENKKVVRYHKMFSAIVSEDENNLYLMMDRPAYQLKRKYLTSILGTENTTI